MAFYRTGDKAVAIFKHYCKAAYIACGVGKKIMIPQRSAKRVIFKSKGR